MPQLQKISPCLWFDGQAEEAAEFYVSVFPDSAIDRIMRWGQDGVGDHGQPDGKVLLVSFRLAGQSFSALNGGPQFHFTEAVSLMVGCESEQEVDYYWERLGPDGGGEAGDCGWLKDRFGLSWQIAPLELLDMYHSGDVPAAERAMKAMMTMQKLDLPALRKAYRGA